MDKQILINNLSKIHTTPMGLDRIKRNLNLEIKDIVSYLKNIILNKDCIVYKQGKNYYCELKQIKITINSYSYTIITAHKFA